MYRFRLAARFTGAVALAATLVSCTDSPSAPPAPNRSLLGGVVGTVTGTVDGVVTSLVSCNVTTTSSASQRIGPAGGTLRVGPHTFQVPAGALDRDVTISAVAPAGKIVKVEFRPEGLRFARPTTLTLSYRSCGLLGSLDWVVVYLDDNDRTILEVLPSVPNLLSRTVSGRVDHFSNYAIAERRPLR